MTTARVLPEVAQVVRLPHGRPIWQLARVERAFVGRDRELGELVAAVASGAARIWIGGASGLGKTELLIQLVGRCRERGLPYHWLAPHEPATPRALRAIAEELVRAAGPRDGRRLLVIDDFAKLRPIEPWFVERFLPALPASVSVVVADRAAAPVWPRSGGGVVVALAPLAEAEARRYLAWRGVADDRHAEILAGAEGIPSILVAAAEAVAGLPPAARAFIDAAAAFYTRHASEDHRLAIAVLVAARTTPYELLEHAFDDPDAARDAYAWLSRLTVVEPTPSGLRPDTLLRKAWERELADRAPGLWARARRAARAFADHRIAMAHEPQRWLLDRLFVDRDARAVRAHMTLPAAEPPLALAALRGDDRPGVTAIAAANHGRQAAAVIARWLDDDRAAIDVLRDPEGQVQGYLCSVAITAASGAPGGDPAADPAIDAAADPAIRQCVAHLRAVGWFGPATPPDARALVFRDWSVAGVHQAPSPGAALLLAQIAARLLTTPAVELAFVVTDQPAAWQRLIGSLGLAPHPVGEHRWGERQYSVLAVDWRAGSVARVLHAVGAAAPGAGPALAPSDDPRPAPVTTTGRMPPVRNDEAPAPAAEPRSGGADEARELSAALERRIAQLARTAALSPREQQVLQLLLLGRNYAEIGVALQITPRTARFHQTNVLDKLGAESRLDLVRLLL